MNSTKKSAYDICKLNTVTSAGNQNLSGFRSFAHPMPVTWAPGSSLTCWFSKRMRMRKREGISSVARSAVPLTVIGVPYTFSNHEKGI